MLEAANRKLFRKHWRTTSRTSDMKTGMRVPLRQGKVSTEPGGTVFLPWAWLLNLVDLHT